MIDLVMDFIADTIDGLARANNFEAIDIILYETNVHALPTDLVLTLLTATFCCKSRLKWRSSFFEEAKKELGDELVKGLK